MIRLETPFYCEECGNFEVETSMMIKKDMNGIPTDHVTVIGCKHLGKCRRAVSIALTEYKRGEKDGNL